MALTYDKQSGVAKIYCNGVVVAQQDLGTFTPETSYDLYLGKRPPTLTGSDVSEDFFYTGLLDEIALYNRALSASEIQAICSDQNGGELPPAPTPGIGRFPGGFGYDGRNGNGIILRDGPLP